MSDSPDTPTRDDKFPPAHHWRTHEGGWVTCVECEAHSSWCDYPPAGREARPVARTTTPTTGQEA